MTRFVRRRQPKLPAIPQQLTYQTAAVPKALAAAAHDFARAYDNRCHADGISFYLRVLAVRWVDPASLGASFKNATVDNDRVVRVDWQAWSVAEQERSAPKPRVRKRTHSALCVADMLLNAGSGAPLLAFSPRPRPAAIAGAERSAALGEVLLSCVVNSASAKRDPQL